MAEIMEKEHVAPFSVLCCNPVFFIQIILIIVLFITNVIGSVKDEWPNFHTNYRWAYFLNSGTAFSLFFFEFSSILSWIVFENTNWVHYVLTYLGHGSILMALQILFFYDTVTTFTESKPLWPCVEHTDSHCKISTHRLVTGSLLIILASAYLCLSFYIMVVKRKFARLKYGGLWFGQYAGRK